MSARSRLPHVAVGLAAALGSLRPCAAQTAPKAPDAPAEAGLARALAATQKSGRPTIVIATSRANPGSQAIGREFLGICKARGVERSAQVIELAAESAPEAVRRYKLAAYPAVLAFRQGAREPELVGREDPAKDAFDALGYISALDLAPAVAGAGRTADPAVVRSNHNLCDPLPSAQGYAPPQPVPVAAPAPAPQPQYVTPMMAAPANPYVGSPSPSPLVVSAPSPSIVFQQSAPTIYMAPPQAPTVVVGTAPPSMPNVSFAPTVSASPPQQPQQMFLMAAPAPAPAPMVAAPAPAPAPVSAYPVTLAASPAPMAVAAPAPAQVQLATAAAPTTVAVTAIRPGPLGRLVGNLGERLVKHKYPRVAGVATTTTTTVLAQPITTLSAPAPIQVQTVAAPAPAPQQYVTAAPPQVAQPQPQPQYQPPPALATPQQTGPSGFGIFKHR